MLREFARSAGISGHEIFYSKTSSASLAFSSGEIKSKEQSSEKGYGIRVLKDKRLGFAYCEKEADVPGAVAQAASLSAYSPATGFSFVPKTNHPQMQLLDKKIDGLDVAELKAMLSQIREGIEKNGSRPRITISAGTEDMSLENDAGFAGSYKSSAFFAYAEATDKDGFGFSYLDGISLPKDFTAIGDSAGKMAKAMRNAKKPKSGFYGAIFEPTALEDLFNVLFPSLSGEWKRKSTSLLAERSGEQVFNPQLSIYDSPLVPAASARPFDDEGTASRRIPLIEDGVLKNFIYDRETAALEGVDRSGFCSRSHFSSAPSASRSNIEIAAGEHTNLEQELPACLIVHSLHGSHTANTTTGDFGLEVNVAFHKSARNADAMPVRGFLISGNIFKLLKDTLYVEKQRQIVGDMLIPRIAFENVRVVS